MPRTTRTTARMVTTIINTNKAIERMSPTIASLFFQPAEDAFFIPIIAMIKLAIAEIVLRDEVKIDVYAQQLQGKNNIQARIPRIIEMMPSAKPLFFGFGPKLAEGSSSEIQLPQTPQKLEPFSSSAPQKLQFIKILLSKSDTLIISQNLTKIKLFG